MNDRLVELIESLPHSIRYEGNTEALIKYTVDLEERLKRTEQSRDDYKRKWQKLLRRKLNE